MIYDFVAEHNFLFQLNTNKDDRKYMRTFADQKLTMFQDAVVVGKNKNKK